MDSKSSQQAQHQHQQYHARNEVSAVHGGVSFIGRGKVEAPWSKPDGGGGTDPDTPPSLAVYQNGNESPLCPAIELPSDVSKGGTTSHQTLRHASASSAAIDAGMAPASTSLTTRPTEPRLHHDHLTSFSQEKFQPQMSGATNELAPIARRQYPSIQVMMSIPETSKQSAATAGGSASQTAAVRLRAHCSQRQSAPKRPRPRIDRIGSQTSA